MTERDYEQEPLPPHHALVLDLWEADEIHAMVLWMVWSYRDNPSVEVTHEVLTWTFRTVTGMVAPEGGFHSRLKRHCESTFLEREGSGANTTYRVGTKALSVMDQAFVAWRTSGELTPVLGINGETKRPTSGGER